ncbi:DUF3040 domain-containing protein [Nocardia sp. SYP-A9097]|uniref:DUF3040 domain-containing protein n=1 Tax=Nocardia sp. SYP-A9097 TaxID=2663237 RepID=UPI001327D250|nr:DUF3040 domain-containing protein [Nocardia sp. SYP-A9097]MRH92550.1 DUF3040 domain-containing protein [Nocardia sp. SYP-A9097]
MPLSEHEQRMLEQIESALYAEDPKFASTVRGGRLRSATGRRRLQSAALFVLGLFLLVAGIAAPVKLGDFPIISLIGFIVMFGAGVLLLTGGPGMKSQGGRGSDGHPSSGSGPGGGQGRPKKAGGFSSRMEDRFRRRFEQDN